MAQSIRLVPETLRSLAFGSVGASYMGVGTAFDNPIRIIFIQNLTDVTLLFSWDGINDHFRLPRDGYLLLDVSANKNREHGMYISEGTRIYVKEDGTPTSGTIDVSVLYGYND